MTFAAPALYSLHDPTGKKKKEKKKEIWGVRWLADYYC
jgi:rRNA maturation protein Nop10